jgi:hypothetical protein
MTSELLMFAELDAALERCMKAHPTIGDERRMHPDANTMANLWAPMVLRRQSNVLVADVDERVLVAFRRWQTPS